MLEGLNSVAWHEIDHAYGPALDTPGHLRALLSNDPEVVAQAVKDLDRTVHEEGGFVCPAATAVLPFLVEVLPVLEPGPRAALLDMIERIADDGENAEQVDPGWPAAWARARPAIRPA
ncbi:hypothetical protein SK803_23380 [Lentzea sp. BCCO 10_0856]|uniref:HEAT repeat-containing protein n=1 Tax=Lentzea miocenica TaxID=3095431 RepID=A0ABU4T4S6_9PSEU|nr:hypothetical protein [Lentzea sp. BCCO 10_0856]MDX8033170.1 hypothetical protein [Lentzea sp. BCCO 10_0856]